LLTVAKLGSPIAPFFMDQLYRDLTGVTSRNYTESVHLERFPIFEKELIDVSLERKMQKAQAISSMVLSLRKKEMIKVRQPLQRIMIPVLDAQDREDIKAIEDLIIAEVNVKEIELIDDASGILVKNIKPNFKILGPKFGKDMRLVASEIEKLTQEDINKIEKDGSISFEINGKKSILTHDEFDISSQDIEGWLVANQGNLTVALDVTISDELRKEGIARELINRIQNFRKESGFDVTDKIKLSVLKDGIVEKAILENENYIKTETLTDQLLLEDEVKNGIEVAFDEVNTKLLIEKI
jgi:isoleucyl-tRNA synthetase